MYIYMYKCDSVLTFNGPRWFHLSMCCSVCYCVFQCVAV